MLAEIADWVGVQWPPRIPELLFWGALALVVGGVLGEFVRRWLGWPRIVGYSAVGLLLAIAGRGVAGTEMSGTTRLVVDLALALLLFDLGSRVPLRWLRANPALLATSAAEALLGFAAAYGALRLAGVDTNAALTLAAIGIAASGAVVFRTAAELGAAGQVTDRMIVLAALNTLLAVLAHKLVVGWLHLDEAGNWVQAVSQPLWTLGGSFLLALGLSRLVAFGARRLDLRDENAVLLLLGLVVCALALARTLNLSTLLVPLLAGVLLRNLDERPWVWPRHFGTAGGVLVLMLFVVVGASWTPQALAAGAAAAIALLLARFAGKGLAVVALARWSGLELRQGMALALTLTPVSGTALVLLADVVAAHPAFAARIAPVALSAIAIMAVLGPLAVQWGLRLAGEAQPHAAAGGR